MKSPKVKYGDFILVHNKDHKSSFSFFKWIFINPEDDTLEDMDKIIAHESIHAGQYHCFDLILIELVISVMWFNPIIWMIRNSIRLLHEYIADEGALNSGIEKINYQVTLVNQLAGAKLISFSSHFSQSLIKKRLDMISDNKLHQKSKLRILVLVPITFILFFGIACFNGCTLKNESRKETDNKTINVPSVDSTNESKIVTTISPQKINVFYRGVKNPVSISVSGVPEKILQATITKGTVIREGDAWVVLPADGPEGEMVTVKVSAKINNIVRHLGQMNFTVKDIPDPTAEVAGRSQGVISLDELKNAGGVEAKLKNFNMDVKFTVIEFTLFAAIPSGFTYNEISSSNKLTPTQLEIISRLKHTQRITFENIKAVGPDGKIRTLNSIVLKIL